MLTSEDLRLFHAGRLLDAYDKLGAHCTTVDATAGVTFATWAPRASSVGVVGDFNGWDGRSHLMRPIDDGGVWQLFIPGLEPGAHYKFEIKNARTGQLVIKTDPYARAFPHRSNQNAVVTAPSAYRWEDAAWLTRRRDWRWQDQPLNIYEVHLSSWRRRPDAAFLSYDQLADELTRYAREMRFSHVELLPVFEHPLDESLGYQVTGYYAPTSRFGAPDSFRAFVDRCHQGGIGVILDWVPLHFPKDFWALAEFDGAPLYERDDPNMAEHPQWRTLIFNYGRPEVRNFLLANALYWLREFHVDGLRFDAVSSMLYLDDARGRAFTPNPLGGRENLPAVKFLREMNSKIGELVPDAFTIAEESTSWPAVSQPARRGGLGFSMRWNMGWVHDTLHYMALPWNERPQHHRDLTFERLYAKRERFVLALSHDEVALARGSLFQKMAGDDEQKFAGLRLLFTYQTTYPGKKLTFMGNEFGQRQAWDPTLELHWQELANDRNRQLAATLRDLAARYQELVALHADDADHTGFRWLDPDDAERCIISYLRLFGEAFAIVVLNFSTNVYEEYMVGAPRAGTYQVTFDSDASAYGGSGAARLLRADSTPDPCMSLPFSLSLRLPALSGVVITPA
ncbi:MAG: 1,4-alpha-glucan branching protein GlgB [Candidatus Eremiobacteraeota bacterium]|nr:1,4-alpha-glucan branching protein GlgB [Candidatus Eremiobacteraeota bacterium]